MVRIGLTGGIGSGKSTVAGMLAEHGATVIDAYAIARELVEPGGRLAAPPQVLAQGALGGVARHDVVRDGRQRLAEVDRRGEGIGAAGVAAVPR